MIIFPATDCEDGGTCFPGNAIRNAATPVMDALAEAESQGEYTTLDASGLSVGIPAGVMGNSEVGHFTIGTGRVVYQVKMILLVACLQWFSLLCIETHCVAHLQNLVAINMAITDKTLALKPVLVDAFNTAKAKNGRLHFLGLVSPPETFPTYSGT